jgi:transposase
VRTRRAAALYVFIGKSATRVKVLWWDRNGCLLYKRLHRALFRPPEASEGAVSVRIDGAALAQLLAGVATACVFRRNRSPIPNGPDQLAESRQPRRVPGPTPYPLSAFGGSGG